MTDAPVTATDPHPQAVEPFDPRGAFGPAKPTDAELDAEIRRDVQVLAGSMRRTVEAAWRLGRKLMARKRTLQHGDWLPYLADMGLPARTAQECMAVAAKYAESAHLPGSIRAALEASPVDRRKAAVLRLWPGLRERTDRATLAVIDRYVTIAAAVIEGGGDFPAAADLAWAFGVEHLFDREAAWRAKSPSR